MIVLNCKNIKKSYGINEILKSVSFSINEGEKAGFIGANGAGKSTLFKIITGETEYDSGELYIDKNKKLGYLSQHLSLDSSNTVFDEMLTVFSNLVNIENKLKELETLLNEPYDPSKEEYHDKIIRDYASLCESYKIRGGYTYRGEIKKVLSGLGFIESDLTKNIRILSGGQKTRVALCKLLLVKPDILLLDEPTNHLDLEAIEWLENYLKDYKGTVITISHDRYFLDEVTTRTLELINGHVISYNGNYSIFVGEKKRNYEIEMKAYLLQQNEIKRQEQIIERYRSFNREKSIKAAESREKALNKIERIKQPDKDSKASNIKFETMIESGNDVLFCQNLGKSYDGKKLFSNVNLDIKRSEKIALIGENGRGKTTLFKIILNKVKAENGIAVLGKNVFTGYYDQEQSDLNPDSSVIDEVWDCYPELTTTEIRSALAAFLFKDDDVFKKISSLSGGEKCRINLLKLMLSKSNFLLLDEPTNHLDIMSREALEDALINYNGTVFVISHDRYFLNKVINKIYELEENGIKQYFGNYTYYTEKKKNPLRFEEEEYSSGKTKTQIEHEKKKMRDAKKQEKEFNIKIKSIEDSISSIESQISSLQKKLCEKEVYSNPTRSEEINTAIKDNQKKLDELYAEWENLI